MTALTHAKIRKFGKPVRDLLVLAVNTHGIDYRLQRDGQHVLLYSGRVGESPYKVSSSRPPEQAVEYLRTWLGEHVPDFEREESDE